MSHTIKQLWKQSASLIILGRNKDAIKTNGFNYKVCIQWVFLFCVCVFSLEALT